MSAEEHSKIWKPKVYTTTYHVKFDPVARVKDMIREQFSTSGCTKTPKLITNIRFRDRT